MRRLSGPDSFFLISEGPSWHTHTCGLVVVDPTGLPDYGPHTLRALLEARLPLVPQFTSKLREVPLGLDRPVLVPDEGFDLDAHLHRIAVPAPGGPRELAEIVGELMAIKLDRSRPLWEYWWIEGLEGGRVAMLAKTHHALVDGVSGAGLADVLCDVAADAPLDRPPPAASSLASEPVPSQLELFARGIPSALATPIRFGRLGWQLVTQGVELLRFSRREHRPRTMLDQAPKAPFNAPLSPLRRFAYTTVPLDKVKRVRERHGVKINDVVLALVGSSLRRYLLGTGELPAESLVAAVPISTRTEEQAGQLGNFITNMMVSLGTDLDDPVERLLGIHDETVGAKEMAAALQAHKLMALSDTTPPALANVLWRMYAQNMEALALMPANVIVSNVPGPLFPLYSGGARIEEMIPVSALLLGMGLNITVMSYLDQMSFGFTTDRRLLPDPWILAEGVDLALDELREATAAPA